MGTGIDFLKWLETDMSMDIMSCLDDPSDLARVSSVSRFWRHFGELPTTLETFVYPCGFAQMVGHLLKKE